MEKKLWRRHTHTLLSRSCACAYLVDFSAQPKRLSKVSFQDQNRAWTHAYKDPSYFVSVANILHLPFKTNENQFSASTISSYTSVLCREFLLTSDLRNFSNFMRNHSEMDKFFFSLKITKRGKLSFADFTFYTISEKWNHNHLRFT